MRELSSIEDETAAQVATSVRERRERLGLTLRALAARSGVSPSMISDIERRTKSPTISTLAALAKALDVSVAALVDRPLPAVKRLRIVRAADRAAAADPASGVRRESFGPALAGSRIEFLRCIVPPHGVAGPFPAHDSGTIEHVQLAAGSIRLILGADSVLLQPGDSCSCLADLPHSFDNREGAVEAVLYVVIEPP